MLSGRCRAFAFLGLAAVSTGAPAHDAPALETCVALRNDAERLACYDRAMGQTGTIPTAVALPAEQPDAAADATEQFGLSEAQRNARSGSLPVESVELTVRSVVERGSGHRLLTMESGQVWTDVEPYSSVRVRPGDRIAIRRGALGSFFLIAPGGAGTKVRRLQ